MKDEPKSESEQIIEQYIGEVCPDCNYPIPKYVANGDGCVNCGHAFYLATDCDDVKKAAVEVK